jgi:hypothetical protein
MIVGGREYKVWSKEDGDASITTQNVDELIGYLEAGEKN